MDLPDPSSRLARETAEAIAIGMELYVIQTQELRKLALKSGLNLGDNPFPVCRVDLEWNSEPLCLHVEDNERPFMETTKLVSWLHECYSSALELSAYSRMLKYRIIDHMAALLHQPFPSYAVDDDMRGFLNFKGLDGDQSQLHDLIRHGVPYFEVNTLLLQPPANSEIPPPSHITPATNQPSATVYPKFWTVVPPACSVAFSACGFWQLAKELVTRNPLVDEDLLTYWNWKEFGWWDDGDEFFPLWEKNGNHTQNTSGVDLPVRSSYCCHEQA